MAMKRWTGQKWVISGMAALFLLAAVVINPGKAYSVEEVDLDAEVAAAVAGGQTFLFNHFHLEGDGTTGYYWDDSDADYYKLAATAAAVASLIETGKYKDAAYKEQIDKAVLYIKAQKQSDGGIYQQSSKIYQNGMSLVALSLYYSVTEQPEEFVTDYIQPAVNYFLTGQNDDGSWDYSPCGNYCETNSGDLSNTQFGIMGLWYAYHYVLDEQVPTEEEGSWANRLLDYVKGTQNPETGCFTYGTYEGYSDFEAGPMNGAGLWTLAMLGIDQTDLSVQGSLDWFNANYAWDHTAGYDGSDESYYDINHAYYYGIYAMAKGLTGMIPATYKFPSAENAWVTDLKQALVNKKSTPDENEEDYYWVSGQSLDPGTIISTSWVIMSLSFADPETKSITKRLPDTLEPDYPVKGFGVVILEATGGVTISGANRGNIVHQKSDKVRLPIGTFDFVLNDVPVGGTAVLKIIPPAAALNPNTSNSFLDENGEIMDGLRWFKLRNGEWKGLSSVPIQLMPEAGPYTYIEVKLKDGGPEDVDGEANGVIMDPGAPGVGGSSDGSDNDNPCFIGTAAF